MSTMRELKGRVGSVVSSQNISGAMKNFIGKVA